MDDEDIKDGRCAPSSLLVIVVEVLGALVALVAVIP